MGNMFEQKKNIVGFKKIKGPERKYYPNQKREYVFLARGGHCGKGYFMPILLSIGASSFEEAKRKALDTGRVKHDQTGAIIYGEERSFLETYLVNFINDWDPYITTSENDGSVDERKIILPIVLDSLYKEIYSNKYSAETKEEMESEIRTAEKYPENFVLQKYLAPRRINGAIVFPKTIDFDNMLLEYFTTKVKEIAIDGFDTEYFGGNVIVAPNGQTIDSEVFGEFKKGDGNLPCADYEKYFVLVQMLLCYYGLFATDKEDQRGIKPNPLGIRICGNHMLSFEKTNGDEKDIVFVKIPQMSMDDFRIQYPSCRFNIFNVATINNMEGIVFNQKTKPTYEAIFEEISYSYSLGNAKAAGVKTGLERFNARYGKPQDESGDGQSSL